VTVVINTKARNTRRFLGVRLPALKKISSPGKAQKERYIAGSLDKAEIVLERPFDKEAATVVTLTVTSVGPEPLGVTDGLEKEHVEPAGAPVQVKATA
jgi:hypothetical protein